MTYAEARDYIEKIGKKGSIPGLENICGLMHMLSDIQEKLKIIHIAGTNGKGSTSAYISGILKQAGYKVGRFSSPAVFEYLEIFTINDVPISEQEYADCMENVREASETLTASGGGEPTAFEMETALAFLYFYRNDCDFVILETGMGGTFDSTNVISAPVCSVITSVSMDHMNFLGNTLYEIAGQKAGIIKQGRPVITAEQKEEVLTVIRQRALQKRAEFIRVEKPRRIFCHPEGTVMDYVSSSGIFLKDIHTRMLGTFQAENMAVAIETVLWLKKAGLPIFEEDIKKGIANARWPGRFERVCSRPAVYLDGGHNPGAAERIRETMEIYFTNSKIIYIMGVLADKDYETVLSITAPLADEIITITPDHVRGLDGKILAEAAKKYNKNVFCAEHLEQAITQAAASAGTGGVILVFGSLSYLAKAKEGMRKYVDWKERI
ncbi:MAG: bifunctional folylpolyglutamate synthase/dihydrofolate synthase [Lachnospiraceae bacterium]|nr:bifunctional folylpolyglutamate synthase/dihydrofolate synthase [Lachnospiraceae bacterium]